MSATIDRKGLTDSDVEDMYRWLLGRAPENLDTVRAFRSYYPDAGQGRRAVFESDEFRRYYAAETGRPMVDAPDTLALNFLRRAGGTVRTAQEDERPAVRAGMTAMLRSMQGGTGFALVVGRAEARLTDLAPLETACSAVLHVAPDYPAIVPLSGVQGEALMFGVAFDMAALGGFLREMDRQIGLLVLLGAPADASAAALLRPFLAPRALVVIGPGREDFDAVALRDAVAAWGGTEASAAWLGFSVWHAGGWHLPVSYAAPPALPVLPNAEEYPALAIACIVRNEALSIGHMLRSALPVAAFVALLDSGSSDDGTRQAARAVLHQSGIPFVVEAAALERFDDMRNAALDLVPDWVAWVLMLDADEALAPEDFTPLLALLRSADKDAYALPRYNYLGTDMRGPVTPYPDRQIRLLRHTPDRRVRYSGAVHETVRGVTTGLVPLDGAALGLARGGPHIHHLVRRFRTPEEEARKQAHYRDLAKRLGP